MHDFKFISINHVINVINQNNNITFTSLISSCPTVPSLRPVYYSAKQVCRCQHASGLIRLLELRFGPFRLTTPVIQRSMPPVSAPFPSKPNKFETAILKLAISLLLTPIPSLLFLPIVPQGFSCWLPFFIILNLIFGNIF